MADFRMPSLGADMDSGKLLEWRVAPGDHVHRGDIVATVDTSKAEIDIEVFEDGVVDELVVQPGEKVPVGAVLATIRTDALAGEPEPDADMPAASAAPAEIVPEPPPLAARVPKPPARSPEPAAALRAPPPARAAGNGRVLASPYARRLTAERGVSLGGLPGSGPEGAVLAADVPPAPRPCPPEPSPTGPSRCARRSPRR